MRAVLEKEVPIDTKLRKEIEGPAIAPIAGKVKKKAVEKKAEAAKKVEKKAPEPVEEDALSGLGILDDADARVKAETKKRVKPGKVEEIKIQDVKAPEPEKVPADVAALGGLEGDVDWQGLFDEVDKSIREELKKKKTAESEGEEVDFDFD